MSENESLARMAIAAFVAPLDPSMDELTDIKTSISEAVTNAIIHGYENGPGTVELTAVIEDERLTIKIADKGKGIVDIDKAKEPLFTTKPELERSGMGFTIMESFMDSLEIISSKSLGTTVIMTKLIKANRQNECAV
jgi:stage II sporulation protein AB (anti-sigma F factor)